VRTFAVATLVAVPLAASALDLALGVLWVLGLVVVFLLRRRLRAAPILIVLAAATLLVWGGQLGWFPAPAPVSYEAGWIPGWATARAPAPGPGTPPDPGIVAGRERLAALRRDELRLTGPEIEQRAGALIGASRRMDSLRADAPREAGALEAAARRLARTLAAPEFRDLEARRAAIAAYLTDLDQRLASARDGAEAGAVLRAADPAAMAHVSLRPVRDDLAAAGAAVEALVRVLGGGVPTATTTAALRYDEDRDEVRWDARYVVAGAPAVRLLRVEMRPFRSAVPSGIPLTATYAPGGEASRPVPPGTWLEIEPASRGVTVGLAWAQPAAPRPVRAPFRQLVFQRLALESPLRADDAMVMAVLDGRSGIELPLFVTLPAARVGRAVTPRHALYFASGAGAAATDRDGDGWEPAGDPSGRIDLELVPRSLFLRNAAFAWARGYLFRTNPGTVVAAVGLAALALVLVQRRRPPAAPGA
jgi:hypothetical protein